MSPLVACALVAALLFAGCSGSGTDSSSSPATSAARPPTSTTSSTTSATTTTTSDTTTSPTSSAPPPQTGPSYRFVQVSVWLNGTGPPTPPPINPTVCDPDGNARADYASHALHIRGGATDYDPSMGYITFLRPNINDPAATPGDCPNPPTFDGMLEGNQTYGWTFRGHTEKADMAPQAGGVRINEAYLTPGKSTDRSMDFRWTRSDGAQFHYIGKIRYTLVGFWRHADVNTAFDSHGFGYDDGEGVWHNGN